MADSLELSSSTVINRSSTLQSPSQSSISQSDIDDNNTTINISDDALVKPAIKKTKKKRNLSNSSSNPHTLAYHGINISAASAQGNLPICVLLWGMAAAKRINLMQPDDNGCNPMHYAAMADNPEVLGFINQQTRGFLVPTDTKLIDSRNNTGETPLFRSMYNGRISVVKSLLDDGSDPFVRDNDGNTIIIICVKRSHLWCLHFLNLTIKSKYGEVATNQLFHATDNDNHDALDWASYNGDLNIIEYLIRIGLSPYRVDNHNRSCIFWSIYNEYVLSTRYLVRIGCSLHLRDSSNISPFLIAKSKLNYELSQAINEKPYFQPITEKSTYSLDLKNSSSIAMTTINSDRNPINSIKESVAILIDSKTDSTTTISTDSNTDISRQNSALTTMLQQNTSSNVILNPITTTTIPLYTINKKLRNKLLLNQSSIFENRTNYKYISSNAIVRSYKSRSKFRPALLWGILIWGVYITSIFVSWWVWIIELIFITFLFRYIDKYCKTKSKDKFKLKTGISKAIESIAISQNIQDKRSDKLIEKQIDKSINKINDKPIDTSIDNSLNDSQDRTINIELDTKLTTSSTDKTNILSTYFYPFLDTYLSTYNYKFIRFMNCPERYLGVYIGFFLIYLTFMIICYFSSINQQNKIYFFNIFNELMINQNIFISIVISMIISLIVWICLVWLFIDPGIIDTREFDFNEIMDFSIRIGGAPPSHQVCRTTLIRKPLRSKYCSQLGVVIARMDHHCVWLNNSVGYKNHRLFIIFLFIHLLTVTLMSTLLIRLFISQFSGNNTCNTIDLIFSKQYFFMIILLFASLLIGLALLALTLEQSYNILNNITTNERINGHRYSWLTDDNGNRLNRFHRGYITNLFEFCQIPGYNVDYYTIFEVPIASATTNTSVPNRRFSANDFTSNIITSYFIPTSNNRSRSSSLSSNTSNISLGIEFDTISNS